MKNLKNRLKYYLVRLSKIRYFNRWVIFLIDLFLSVVATAVIEIFVESNLRMPIFSTSLLILASLLVSIASIFLFRTYIGVIRYALYAYGEVSVDAARDAFLESAALCENPWALRNLSSIKQKR